MRALALDGWLSMSDNGGAAGWVKWAIGAVLVPIVAALIAAGVFHWGPVSFPFPVPGTDTRPPAPPEITLSRASAPRGAKLTVFGSGFRSGELVEIRVHVTTVGTVTADSEGKFRQDVTVPESAPPPNFPTSVSATGHSSIKTATAPFSTG
jgi:hypothetical protein